MLAASVYVLSAIVAQNARPFVVGRMANQWAWLWRLICSIHDVFYGCPLCPGRKRPKGMPLIPGMGGGLSRTVEGTKHGMEGGKRKKASELVAGRKRQKRIRRTSREKSKGTTESMEEGKGSRQRELTAIIPPGSMGATSTTDAGWSVCVALFYFHLCT